MCSFACGVQHVAVLYGTAHRYGINNIVGRDPFATYATAATTKLIFIVTKETGCARSMNPCIKYTDATPELLSYDWRGHQ